MAGSDLHLRPPRIAHEAADEPVGLPAGPARQKAPGLTTKAAGVLGDGGAGKATTQRSATARRARRAQGGAWDADDVAAHLMGCQAQMVRGLSRKTPWAGLDDETMASCFGHGAAVISKVAASGQRPEWRTPKDLEKAQIAAFRHQALEYWKRANAQSRRGERFTVAFDPERHAPGHAPMDRLFEQPDLHTIERDLLAELIDDHLRAFWATVLREQVSFKEAGDRLGLSKAEVMSCTRVGRAAFGSYLDRRSTGELCDQRALDLAASRAGTATTVQAERGAAHLESCYACALVHDPSTSAIQRGILGLAPTGLLLRLISRAGDIAASPATRIADSGSGSRAVAAGLAAVAVAGSGVGIEAATDAPDARTSRDAPRLRAQPRRAPSPPAAVPVTVPRTVAAEPRQSLGRSTPVVAAPARAVRPKRSPPRVARNADPVPVVSHPAPTPAPAEFGFERGSAAVPAPAPRPAPSPATGAPSAPANEFSLP